MTSFRKVLLVVAPVLSLVVVGNVAVALTIGDSAETIFLLLRGLSEHFRISGVVLAIVSIGFSVDELVAHIQVQTPSFLVKSLLSDIPSRDFMGVISTLRNYFCMLGANDNFIWLFNCGL